MSMIRESSVGEQAIEFRFDHLVAFANPRFQSRTIQHRDVAASLSSINPACCNFFAASVTPSRRTPSILAINSWVMVNSFEGSRSRLKSNQRQSCWSTDDAGCRLPSVPSGLKNGVENLPVLLKKERQNLPAIFAILSFLSYIQNYLIGRTAPECGRNWTFFYSHAIRKSWPYKPAEFKRGFVCEARLF